MGLDVVEMLMELEEEFGIELPDEEAQRVATVDDLCRLVLGKVHFAEAPVSCLSSQVFYRIRRGLVATTALPRRQITPRLELAAVLPQPGRQAAWGALRQASQLGLPPLALPPRLQQAEKWLLRLGCALVLALTVVAGVLCPHHPALAGLVPATLLLGLLSLHSVSRALRTRYATLLPPGLDTVGTLTRDIIARGVPCLSRRPAELDTPENVRRRVVDVIAEYASLDRETIAPTAHLYKDLHLG